jgi:hypothetical protein
MLGQAAIDDSSRPLSLQTFARRCGVLASLLIACLSLGSVASPTSAHASWSITPSPNVVGAKESALEGVSCPSLGSCVAVGYSISEGVSSPLAEVLNGGEWHLSAPPLPSGAKSGTLYSVSCSSEVGCTAVGYYVTGSAAAPLAERWNGSEWSIQTLPSGGSLLLSVSCSAAKACMAVGTGAMSEAEFLAERWNGKVWSIQSTPPAGALIKSVSCSSAKACTAVGTTLTATKVVRWNGTEWVIQEAAKREPPQAYVLNGVSCPSAKVCEAVGAAGPILGPSTVSIAEGWNGTEWSSQTPAGAPGESGSVLESVSCATTKSCTATGSWETGSATKNTLANSWNGTGWAFEATPNPAEAVSSKFKAVSCVSSTECVSVGSYQTSGSTVLTLVETKP